MPEFATFDDLERFASKAGQTEVLKEARQRPVKGGVFLAHSSKDTDHLAGVVTVLKNHGSSVYVDKADQRLPTETSTETAELLRQTIRVCNRFVVFVTPNSKSSRWIPWELGLANGEKGSAPLALFPAAGTAYEQQWAEQEYLGLYKRIVWGELQGHEKPLWMVYDHRTNTGTRLREWLTQA